MTKFVIIFLTCISLVASQPIHPNAGKTIAIYQIGSGDAHLEQGVGMDGKDTILQVQFYKKRPSITQADKVCREYLAKAIKQFSSKDILVFAWYGSHKGIPAYDYDEIQIYKGLGFRKHSVGGLVDYRYLIYKDGVIKVE